MRIAILGAGFCGLASAWHLLQHQRDKTPFELVIFDPAGIAGGASGIAAGLMHPYAGAHAKLNPQAFEGMRASLKLLEISGKALGKPVFEATGLLRMAISEDQKRDFSACASLHADVEWCTLERCQALVPGIALAEGLLIKSAVTVNSSQYVQGLWLVCSSLGAQLEQRAIHRLSELADFDVIVVAMGAAAKSLPELAHLPITPIKGQIVECLWPEGMAPLAMPINSQAYIVMNPGNGSCIIGATYERHSSSSEPERNAALIQLQEKAVQLLPALANFQIVKQRAAFRASAPQHQPLLQRFNEKCWVLSGMGSKGLLYHALYAENLSRQIVEAML